MMTTTTEGQLPENMTSVEWSLHTLTHKLNGYSNEKENKKMSITCIARVLLLINWPSDSSCALMDAISELVSMH